MPSAGSLKDIYIEEIRDLWSANDQMQRIMHNMSQKAADKKLKDLLDRSVEGIAKHSETLRSVLESQGSRVAKEHCKGMEGLVAEAKKHAIDADVEEFPARSCHHRSIPAHVALWLGRLRHGRRLRSGARRKKRCGQAERDRQGHLQGG